MPNRQMRSRSFPGIHNDRLVGGFNPIEKYESNWKSSPSRGENRKYLKPPPSRFLAYLKLRLFLEFVSFGRTSCLNIDVQVPQIHGKNTHTHLTALLASPNHLFLFGMDIKPKDQTDPSNHPRLKEFLFRRSFMEFLPLVRTGPKKHSLTEVA